MTDNEIIKALERVKEQYGVDCYECKYKRLCKNKVCPFHTCDYALDLIKRQQADIEKKDRILESYALQYGTAVDKERIIKAELEKLHPYKLHYGNLRMEIAREFADRLIKEAENVEIDREGDFVETENRIYPTVADWFKEITNNLLKEMEKETQECDSV